MPLKREKWPGALEWRISIYLQAHTVKQTAEKFGMTQQRLTNYMYKNRWSSKQGGLLAKDLEGLLGVCKQTLCSMMRHSGVRFTKVVGKRGKGYYCISDYELDQFMEYVARITAKKAGMSSTAAYERLGLCWRRFQKLAEEAGVSLARTPGVNGVRISEDEYRKIEQRLIYEMRQAA